MSVEAEICFKPNINKFASAVVHILVYAVNYNVFTCRVNHERERVKEFGIQEMWDKKFNIHV